MSHRSDPTSVLHPPAYRVGSETTNPEAPQARTYDNHESIRVSNVGNLAIRIAPDGYRVLVQTDPGGRLYLLDHRGQRTYALLTLDGVIGVLDWLVQEGRTTVETATAAKASVKGWPENAGQAWPLLHRGPGQPLPPFAPEGMTVPQ